MTLLQDFALVGEAGEELVEFAEGQTVTSEPIIIGTSAYILSAQKFGETQPPAPYVAFGGSALNILVFGVTEFEALQSGIPVSIAEKIGNTWYGETITLVPHKAGGATQQTA